MDEEALDPGLMLERSARLSAATRAEATPNVLAWLCGLAALMPVTYTGIGAARDDGGIVAVALVFALTVGALSSLLLRARAFPVGFSRSFSPAMLWWGAAFAITLAVGLLFFRFELVYWIPAGFVPAVPLALAARRQLARAR